MTFLAPKYLYSIDEFVALTGIARVTLYREIGDGKLVVRKIGRRTVILDEDARAYLKALPVAVMSQSESKTSGTRERAGRP